MSACFNSGFNPRFRVYDEFGLLNKLDTKSFTNITAVCCSHMKKVDKLAMFESVATRNGLEVKLLQSSSQTLDSLLKSFLEKFLSAEQMEHDLSTLGLSSDKIEIITKCCSSMIGSNQDKLSVLGDISANQLVDMEWKFGVTAASSELDKVGTTFLQLKLKVVNSKGELESLNMELSLTQFYNLLHELEKAKTLLDYI
ncbi:COMMD7 [Bugula neritina]|uniref:COMMD7 n=1 Tax=Bugula neritina TaxID=10212 RepID=A0A7J7KAP5_BUGNE|nr:COMMD7 [Bugula neritina]